ncbi:MAG: NifU family protein [Chitinophagales bacterium]
MMPKQVLLQKIEQALDTIRPHLISDGGNIEVVDLTEDYILKVKLTGNCQFCPMSMMTMQAGVAQSVRVAVPEVKKVVAVNI